jgi:hypothetical protein
MGKEKDKIKIQKLKQIIVVNKIVKTSKQTLYYYRKKASNPNFHNGEHGGHRYTKRSKDQSKCLALLILIFCTVNPLSGRRKLFVEMKSIFPDFTTYEMEKYLSIFSLVRKKAERKNLRKYTNGKY